MKTEEKINQVKSFNPTEFLRVRRPHLFSDSEPTEEINLPKDVFEYCLQTLTTKKREYDFEYFARKLAEKEICPNLIRGCDSKRTEIYYLH